MAKAQPSRVTAVLGPTNTGKTHLAIERLCAHSSGLMGFPLRLLAREVYDRVVAIKGAAEVGLLTGEEKIMPPGARWILSTVESMPVNRDVAFVAIDESQLGADPERGHIFTDRILHARGRDETMILGSASLKPLIRTLIPEAEVIARPRFSKLEFAGSKKLTRLPPRSAIIGFSADEVYAAAELLRRTHGGAAVVMGALSPGTRNAQVALFQSGEVDYIVATDAIGMGLNLDVAHVCFAGLSKFDGKRRRRLSVGEMAQIAGRAGRHHRNGTFGTAAGFGPPIAFTPEEIERIEDHRFHPLDQLFWRNNEIDLAHPARLLTSLSCLPDAPGLRLSPKTIDEEILEILASTPALAQRHWTAPLTERLWSACRVPDFLKRGPDFHAGFVGRLWDHLGQGNGTIPAPWIASELSRLESVQGDIDTLSTRIAAARSWAYIAHQPDWLDHPAEWAERSVALESRLSDALHKKLTERFVDRRSRLLRATRAESAIPTHLSVSVDGNVDLEGEIIGTLRGFEFRPDPKSHHADRKAVMAAIDRTLRPELARRAAEVAGSKDHDFVIGEDDRKQAVVRWRGAIIATLSKGPNLLSPQVKAIPALNGLASTDRDRIVTRTALWMQQRIDRVLKPLRWAMHEAQSPEQPPEMRALLAAIVNGLGHCNRTDVSESLTRITKDQRHWLRMAGINIGPLDVFSDALLKPAAATLAVQIHCVHIGSALLPLPMAGLGLIDKPSPDLAKSAPLAGYRAFGDQMIRIDLVNRIALDLHRQRKGALTFMPENHLATSMGIGVATLAKVMRSLGFRPTASLPGEWRWRGLDRGRPDLRPINPAFAALSRLQIK